MSFSNIKKIGGSLLTVISLLFLSACGTGTAHLKDDVKTNAQQESVRGKPVYGVDNRFELVYAGRSLCHAARAVPGLIPKHWLTSSDNATWTLRALPLLSDTGWCGNQRFATQPAGISCSAILIAANLIATAAHCINAADDQYGPATNCADAAFLFDYRLDANGYIPTEFTQQQVYFCKRIVAGEFSVSDGEWRIVELDRHTERQALPVLDSVPANLVSLQLDVIGHPLGLPLKATTNGSFRSRNSAGSFQVNIDTFEGNSGSPVLSMQSGWPVVIGMLVRGEADSVHSADGNCKMVKQCSESLCAGERVTSSTAFVGWSSNRTSSLDHLPGGSDGMSLCF